MKKWILMALIALILAGCRAQGSEPIAATSAPEAATAPGTTHAPVVTTEPLTTEPVTTQPPTTEAEPVSYYAPYCDFEAPIIPKDAELRDGLYVLRPHTVGEFHDEEWTEEGEFLSHPDGRYYGYELFGCGWWCLAEYWEMAEASSTLPTDSAAEYLSEHILRGSRDLAWAEGAPGYGIGEALTLRYICGPWQYLYDLDTRYGDPERSDLVAVLDGAKETELPAEFLEGHYGLTEMCIVNGYAQNEALWAKNSRVETLLLSIDGVPYAYIELEDTIKPEFFTLYDVRAHFGQPVELRFEIVAVYPGAVADTCITGIDFWVEGISGGH